MELKTFAAEEWVKIPLDRCRKLIESYKNRFFPEAKECVNLFELLGVLTIPSWAPKTGILYISLGGSFTYERHCMSVR